MNVRKKIIHDTKAGRSHLALTWLDLCNVYVSNSLAFIKIALSKKPIPEDSVTSWQVFQLSVFISLAERDTEATQNAIFKSKISVRLFL